MKAAQVKTAKMSELIEFYNHFADRKIKKFQDRATAERRVLETIEMFPSMEEYRDCPDLGRAMPPSADAVRLDNPWKKRNESVTDDENYSEPLTIGPKYRTNTKYNADADAFREAMVAALAETEEKPRKEAKSKEPKLANNRSNAMRQSWENPSVASLRASRVAVKVYHNEKLVGEYKSVAEAFRKLALPFAKHIQFRGYLRQNQEAIINNYRFEVV